MKAKVMVKKEDQVKVAEEEEDLVGEATIRITMEITKTKQLK